MNSRHIDAIASAVLYEGYMLYPYRPSSVKNRQRFNFGVLYPRAYSDAQSGSDAWSMQSECLVEVSPLSKIEDRIEIRVRFLKLVARSVRKLTEAKQQPERTPIYKAVSTLEIDGRVYAPWQEAVECDVAVPGCALGSLAAKKVEWHFDFPAKEETELLRDSRGRLQGQFARKQESVNGVVEVTAMPIDKGIFKLQVRVKDLTAFEEDSVSQISRDSALTRSLVSAHVVLAAENAQFVSLLEPPEHLREAAAGCENVGVWPVLVGAEGERDTMLASPIILYDYPQIAPESPGDLFDGTEIDEILALRILTMTDDEKKEMRNTDDRARKMLDRTEALPTEQLMKLHGTLRELRPAAEHPLHEEMP